MSAHVHEFSNAERGVWREQVDGCSCQAGEQLGDHALVKVVVDGIVIECAPEVAEDVRALVSAANDEGTIQARDMVPVFPGRPEMHTATRLDRALTELGARSVS